MTNSTHHDEGCQGAKSAFELCVMQTLTQNDVLLVLFAAMQQERGIALAIPLQVNPCTATAAQPPTFLHQATISMAQCATERVKTADSLLLPATALDGSSRMVLVHRHRQVCLAAIDLT
jgi:hypothetical protein